MNLSSALVLLTIVSQTPNDPFFSFQAGQQIPFPNSLYSREDFQWALENTGQDSKLYYNGAYQSSEPGGTNSMNMLAAWARQPNAAGVTVGIVDSGCDTNHEDFSGVVIEGRNSGYRWGETPIDDFSESDGSGHGTGLAGVIAAVRGNGLDIAGIAPGVKLLIYRTHWTTPEMTDGVRWCATNGARVILLAWGTATPDDDLQAALLAAHDAGCLVVCALPDLNVDVNGTPDYPTSWHLPGIVPVTGTTRQGMFYGQTAWGGGCLGAPGRIIPTLRPGGGCWYQTGTSFSAANVAGVAALLFAAAPRSTPEAIAGALYAGAVPVVDTPDWEIHHGITCPVVDAARALDWVLTNGPARLSVPTNLRRIL